MQHAHRGEMECRVKDEWKDPDLRRLSTSFNEMCRRLGDESLKYAERQLGSVEEERRRIGRELHDETSQTLTATLVRLDLCDKAVQDHDAAEAHQQLINCKELIGHTIEEIKLLVYEGGRGEGHRRPKENVAHGPTADHKRPPTVLAEKPARPVAVSRPRPRRARPRGWRVR